MLTMSSIKVLLPDIDRLEQIMITELQNDATE